MKDIAKIMDAKIYYREGYKYQLSRPYIIETPILPPAQIEHEFFTLSAQGILVVERGYAWDGASGPTIDTKSSMRGSLVHDCFCQMMHDGDLDYENYADAVHSFFKKLLLEDGMDSPRAWYWHKAVVFARGGNPEHEDCNPEVEAP